jgi:hypothetical protein
MCWSVCYTSRQLRRWRFCRAFFSVADPHLRMDTNPDPIRIQGFNDQKLKKKLQLKIFYFIFLWSKTAIYLSLGLHKVCPSYRRRLQLSKEAIQHFKTRTFTHFFLLLWVIFALLPTDPIESGSNPDPQPWLFYILCFILTSASRWFYFGDLLYCNSSLAWVLRPRSSS